MKAAPLQKNKLTYLPGVKKAAPPRKKTTLYVVVAFLLYFAVLFAGQYWRLIQMKQTLSRIEADISQVKMQNEELKQEIVRLQTPSYLEQIAREELGMVRAGELLFLIRKPDNP